MEKPLKLLNEGHLESCLVSLVEFDKKKLDLPIELSDTINGLSNMYRQLQRRSIRGIVSQKEEIDAMEQLNQRTRKAIREIQNYLVQNPIDAAKESSGNQVVINVDRSIGTDNSTGKNQIEGGIQGNVNLSRNESASNSEES